MRASAGCRIHTILEVLGECANLQMVGFKSCRIAQVSAAELPMRLRWLILTDNAVSQLPDALGERAALHKPTLAGNRLRALHRALLALEVRAFGYLLEEFCPGGNCGGQA